VKKSNPKLSDELLSSARKHLSRWSAGPVPQRF